MTKGCRYFDQILIKAKAILDTDFKTALVHKNISFAAKFVEKIEFFNCIFSLINEKIILNKDLVYCCYGL